ncbi:MAG: hypothetical protein ACI8TQ_001171 [Planctomycetota bacterium]|jgi:hypothetical protein
MKSFAIWLFVLALMLAPNWFGDGQTTDAAREVESVSSRLLGPFSELAAQIQWIRVQKAALEGSSELALVRAETALALDPTATEGWRFVATYLALDLGSPNREANPARRRALIQQALKVCERGESSARSPEQLALWSGILLLTHAETDPDIDWPGGKEQLWKATARAFEHAVELGSLDAIPLAEQARRRLLSKD